MITFNILGCCILRDIFRIADKIQKFKVTKFYQSTGPISFCEVPKNRISQEILGNNFEWTNFVKKCVCADINKTVLADIEGTPSDYLLLDLCELRFRNCKINLQKGDSFFVTQTKYINSILENKDFCNFLGIQSFETDIELDECEIENYLHVFVRFIKEHYKQQQVILVKNLPVWRHLDDEKLCFEEYWIPGITKVREKLEKYYMYIQKLMPEIHIIDMPNPCLGNALHTWGMAPLHFVDEYYQYLYKAIEIITESHSDEKKDLRELRDFYSQYFSKLEKLKRFEYYIAKQPLPQNILQNGELTVNEKGELSGWRSSCSKGSFYSAKEKIISCGNEQNNWAILSQNILIGEVRGKTITFSVEFKTEGESVLNFALCYNDEAGKQVYLFSKQVSSYGERTVYSATVEIPADFNCVEILKFMLYTNKSFHKAAVYKVKAEEGKVSTLF